MEIPPAAVSAEIRQFLLQSIGSVIALELLLLLHRSPETYWMPAAAASTLGATEDRITSAVYELDRASLIARGKDTGGFRYAPSSDADRDVINELAIAYGTYPAAVLDVIYSKPSSVTAFADAFRVRR
jgi:hypothetical protein